MSETNETKEERIPENAEREESKAEGVRPEDDAQNKEERRNKKEEKNPKKELQKLQKEYEALKRESAKLQKELEECRDASKEQNERFLRLAAEYDNFRRRSAAEKDAVYGDAAADVFKEILPVIDALELAVKYGGDGSDSGDGGEKVLKGVEMTLSKFNEALEKLGVEPVETKTFDPNFHNAVMHIEDEVKGEGEIVEVFQKGYKKGDKIIRYAMVKVAN